MTRLLCPGSIVFSEKIDIEPEPHPESRIVRQDPDDRKKD